METGEKIEDFPAENFLPRNKVLGREEAVAGKEELEVLEGLADSDKEGGNRLAGAASAHHKRSSATLGLQAQGAASGIMQVGVSKFTVKELEHGEVRLWVTKSCAGWEANLVANTDKSQGHPKVRKATKNS